jgi:hypothetical protein
VPRQLETTLEVDDGIVRIGRAQEAGAQDARSCVRRLADGPAGACHRSSGGDRGQLLLTMDPKNWIEDKGYIGNNIITPFRKPAGGELLDWQKEYNTQVNKIRWMIEQVVSHFKNWTIMHTDYRRPLGTFKTTISAVVGLHFYRTV